MGTPVGLVVIWHVDLPLRQDTRISNMAITLYHVPFGIDKKIWGSNGAIVTILPPFFILYEIIRRCKIVNWCPVLAIGFHVSPKLCLCQENVNGINSFWILNVIYLCITLVCIPKLSYIRKIIKTAQKKKMKRTRNKKKNNNQFINFATKLR